MSPVVLSDPILGRLVGEHKTSGGHRDEHLDGNNDVDFDDEALTVWVVSQRANLVKDRLLILLLLLLFLLLNLLLQVGVDRGRVDRAIGVGVRELGCLPGLLLVLIHHHSLLLLLIHHHHLLLLLRFYLISGVLLLVLLLL